MSTDKRDPEGPDEATKAEFQKLARTLLNLEEPSEPAKPVQQQQQQQQQEQTPPPEKKEDG